MEQEHKELLFEVGIDTFVNLIDGAQQEVTICLTDEVAPKLIMMFVAPDGTNAIALNEDAIDGMPMMEHGVFMYNDGKFPYLINPDFKAMLLLCNDTCMRVRIKSVREKVQHRFGFDEKRKKYVESPQGECCYWNIVCTVEMDDSQIGVPVVKPEINTYLFRWNPAISNFKIDTYNEMLKNCPYGFRLSWSIWDYQDAKKDDMCYMVRVGDENAGIVYCGLSLGKPEAGKDWAGTTKRRYYLDFGCENPHNTDAIPLISADILERELPELNWRRGHSGEKITLEQASKLHLLWLKYAFRKINGIV